MYTQWRFDQGRVNYLKFENIKSLSEGLIDLTGENPRQKPCVIKSTITSRHPHLNFLPQSEEYPAWRNYARTFGLLNLVPVGRDVSSIHPTKVCEQLALGHAGAFPSFDSYFEYLIGHWRYPHPAFQEYSHEDEPIYPILAILKFLVARQRYEMLGGITVDEIFEYLVFNNMTGLEEIAEYGTLKPRKDLSLNSNDERRQLRELIQFIAQSSVLMFEGEKLELGINCEAMETALSAVKIYRTKPDHDRRTEALLLGGATIAESKLSTIADAADSATSTSGDIEFTEGSAVRKVHLRVERNPSLRRAFLASLPKPISCDVCNTSMSDKYPWAKDFIEIHHKLPLANAIRIGKKSTSFDDLVPVCPNCHKAVHYGYDIYLKAHGKSDFDDETEAKNCYDALKAQYM